MKAIFTKYNAARTRIIASDGDGNQVRFVRESHDSLEGSHAAAARALCEKMGWSGDLIGAHVLKSGASIARVWVFDDERAARIQVHIKPVPSPYDLEMQRHAAR